MFQQLDPNLFDAEVKQSPIPAIVDFSATWCGPCKMLAPTIEKIAKNYEGRVKVYSIDVDQARSLASTFGIRGVPTVIFFKDGAEKDRVSGNVPYEHLVKKLDACCNRRQRENRASMKKSVSIIIIRTTTAGIFSLRTCRSRSPPPRASIRPPKSLSLTNRRQLGHERRLAPLASRGRRPARHPRIQPRFRARRPRGRNRRERRNPLLPQYRHCRQRGFPRTAPAAFRRPRRVRGREHGLRRRGKRVISSRAGLLWQFGQPDVDRSLAGTETGSKPGPTLFASGGHSAYRRDRFLEMGGFDPLFAPFYWEDVDLCYRAWKRGWKILFEPRSAVLHDHQSTIGKVTRSATSKLSGAGTDCCSLGKISATCRACSRSNRVASAANRRATRHAPRARRRRRASQTRSANAAARLKLPMQQLTDREVFKMFSEMFGVPGAEKQRRKKP